MTDEELAWALDQLPRHGNRIDRPDNLALQIRLDAFVEQRGGRVVRSQMRFEPELVLTPSYYEMPPHVAPARSSSPST